MADVRPFRGLRYALKPQETASVVAPPYDVLDGEARKQLLSDDSHNIVAVDLPEDGYDAAAARWRQWRQDGVVVPESRPALYAYKQTFVGPDGNRTKRLGVIGAVKLAAYEERIVFPHERTLTGPKEDRMQLMRATRAQLSPVFGLHFGATGSVDELLAPVCGGAEDETGPVVTMTDGDGVLHEMWVLTEPERIRAIGEVLAPARIVIADGHHRYETALAFRDEERRRLGEDAAPADVAWNYVQMMLVDIESPGLTVFPTHRILRDLPRVSVGSIAERLQADFAVDELPAEGDGAAAASAGLERLGDEPGFVVYAEGRLWLARLKDRDAWVKQTEDKPDAWRSLDVAALHKLALPRLGLDDEMQSSGEWMAYSHTLEETAAMVDRGDGVAAVFVRPTPSTAVKDVALAGHNMPQKSTYYYPKLLTGLVMSDLDTPVGL